MTTQDQKTVTVRTAHARLRDAISRSIRVFGEAQWTNGYRCASGDKDQAEADRLYQKESAQWLAVEAADAMMDKALKVYTQVVRTQAVAKDGRGTKSAKQTTGRRAGKPKKATR